MAEKASQNGAAQKPRGTVEELIHQNVETISAIENASHQARSGGDIVADHVTSFCGSMWFVWVHCVWFVIWLATNTVAPKSMHFDPPPFGNLTLIVSLEAIFLSTFILISQNRQQAIADKRNKLDLQINLLAEQESSQLLKMMQQVMDHLGMKQTDPELAALQAPTDPQALAQELEHAASETSPPEPQK